MTCEFPRWEVTGQGADSRRMLLYYQVLRCVHANGISQVVEINVTPLAVCPLHVEDSEAIENRALRFVPFLQGEGHGCPGEPEQDGAATGAGGGVVLQRPLVTLARLEDEELAALTLAAVRRSVQRRDDSSCVGQAVEVNAHKILQRPTLLAGVEPAQRKAGIDAEFPGDKLAARSEPMLEAQPANAIAIAGLEFVLAGIATEEPAAKFSGLASRMMGRTEAEIILSVFHGAGIPLSIAHAFPLRIAVEVLRLPIDSDVVKVGHDVTSRDSRREDAKAIERRPGLAMFGTQRHPGLGAVERENEFPGSVGGGGIVVHRPFVLRAVGWNSQQRGTGELAHVALLTAACGVYEHSAGLPVARAISQLHQRAVRLIERLQPEPNEIPRPPNQVLLVGIEPADVEVALRVPTRDRLGLQDAYAAGSAKRLLECGWRNLPAVPRRPKRLRHPPAELALRLAGVMRWAVTEILPHNGRRGWPGAVVLPVPLRIAVERLSLD